jgi:hypothetical protein
MMLRLAVAALLLAAPGYPAHAQLGGIRFEITQVGDTTLAFPRGNATWVKPGLAGIAVDPRRRDALVARFRIVSVDSMVHAVVTGQATRIAPEHVAILQMPTRPWYKTMMFWGTLVVGFTLGAITGAAAR